MSNKEVLESIVLRATTELFGAYGVPLEPSCESPDEVMFAAIIGFSGQLARGNLLLVPSEGVLKQSQPLGDAGRDWAGELANQLLGRIKNQLLARGLEIYLTTPVVIRGMKLTPVVRTELQSHRFSSSWGAVTVWFEAELAPTVSLATIDPCPDDASALPSEGDALFF
jgi:CheY-specific phosphatase CheX